VGRRAYVAAHVAVALVLLCSSPLIAQEREAPLAEPEVIELIKQSKGKLEDAAAVLERRGVDFDLDVKVEKKLRKAGADDKIIQDVWKASPAARASQKPILATATGAQLQISPKEGMAFQTMQNELDPGRRLLMVDEFEKEFPNSQILSHVYAQGARAAQEKGDLNKAVEYGEKSLKLDADNLPALLVVATSVSQPSMLRGSDNERNARLAEAQSDANHVLKLLREMLKHAGETDEQLQGRKGGLAADAHFALGMVALLRDESPKAVEEFSAAIKSSVNPTPQYYYRLGEAYTSVGKSGDAIEAFKKTSELGKGTAMEQLAIKRLAELKKANP